jgi:hypothetical protein
VFRRHYRFKKREKEKERRRYDEGKRLCAFRGRQKNQRHPFRFEALGFFEMWALSFLDGDKKTNVYKNDEAFSNFSSQTRAQKLFPRAHKSKEKKTERTTG